MAKEEHGASRLMENSRLENSSKTERARETQRENEKQGGRRGGLREAHALHHTVCHPAGAL